MIRTAFTLIELMIVIAIIAIIAAIAIPNLLESRVTSQEAAGAAALKTGILPAQVQFQAGAYSDDDNNGIGTYAVDGIGASGAATNPYGALTGTVTVGSSITLNLLAPAYCTGVTPYNSANATTASVGQAAIAKDLWPTISGYEFKTPITMTAPSGTSDNTGERVWGVLCFPVDDQQGRKFFMINQAGNIYASKPLATAFSGATVGAGGQKTTVKDVFGASLIGSPASTLYLPYRR
jgi:type IV pilus assembly protein PilA